MWKNKQRNSFVCEEHIFPINKVCLFNLSNERMDNFIFWYKEEKYEFVKCTDIEDLFTETKLVSFATTAGVPFIDENKTLTNERTVRGISLRDFAPSVIEKYIAL
jgi:ornithine cyclodeaminase/alanine dehydrogenase-like protein (mu-crystallin family)